MRILFADSISEASLAPLERDHEIIVEPGLGADDLEHRLTGIDVLVVRSTKVNESALRQADQLGLVVRAGAGTDNIDAVAASGRGVYVCNVPGRNAVAVAELTLGLLLAIDRRIPDNVSDLRAGRWNKTSYSEADGIMGRSLAIIGLGEIGLAVAERAKGFGLQVRALRRDERPADVQARIRSIGVRLVDDLDDLLTDADIVSIHVPKSAATANLVDEAFLAKLKDGAILLNTSRSDVVDGAALLRAIDSKNLRAGLDVWPDEPAKGTASFTSELAKHAAVVGTHHIGASTTQAQESIAEGTVEVIQAYARGQVINCVNLQQDAIGTSCLTIRHLDRVGVLAQVFETLRNHGLNVQQMQNRIFSGAAAAVATVYLDGRPDSTLVPELLAIEEVLAVGAVSMDEGP